MAKELRRPNDMVGASMAQAKLAGWWIERSERICKPLEELSDAELTAMLREGDCAVN
jgi:hypothetical protein